MDEMFKFRINKIELFPDHALLTGAFENVASAPTKMDGVSLPSYNVQIVATREQAKAFDTKLYSVALAPIDEK